MSQQIVCGYLSLVSKTQRTPADGIVEFMRYHSDAVGLRIHGPLSGMMCIYTFMFWE